MKYLTFILSGLTILTILLLASCEKIEIFEDGSIQGRIFVSTQSKTEFPVPGIKIYLFHTGNISDFTSLQNSTLSPIDSTLSNDKGLYNFTIDLEGNYAVLPVAEHEQYRFEAVGGNENIVRTVNVKEKDHTVNFSAPEIIADNSSQLQLIISFLNYQTDTVRPSLIQADGDVFGFDYGDEYIQVTVSRAKKPLWSGEEWFTVAENRIIMQHQVFWTRREDHLSTIINNTKNQVWMFDWGYYGLTSLTNKFRIEVSRKGVDPRLDFTQNFILDLPITGAPEVSIWQIDNKTLTISRIS